jgi:prefoldin subunit 5
VVIKQYLDRNTGTIKQERDQIEKEENTTRTTIKMLNGLQGSEI